MCCVLNEKMTCKYERSEEAPEVAPPGGANTSASSQGGIRLGMGKEFQHLKKYMFKIIFTFKGHNENGLE